MPLLSVIVLTRDEGPNLPYCLDSMRGLDCAVFVVDFGSRESFRPFATSILRAAVAEWFEDDDNVPFMMKVYQVRAERQAEIPAVTHVDGSGRREPRQG